MEKRAQVVGQVRAKKLVRPRDLNGIRGSRFHLWQLAKTGVIDRVGRGLYRDKDSPVSDTETYAELAKRAPGAIICLSSALRFHEISTENPSETWLALERGSWTPKIDFPPVRFVRFSKAAFDFGIETHKRDSIPLRVYSPAKTVADCFKFRSQVGIETAIQALRAAHREKKAKIDEIWAAAKVCRVSNVIRPYMESLT